MDPEKRTYDRINIEPFNKILELNLSTYQTIS